MKNNRLKKSEVESLKKCVSKLLRFSALKDWTIEEKNTVGFTDSHIYLHFKFKKK